MLTLRDEHGTQQRSHTLYYIRSGSRAIDPIATGAPPSAITQNGADNTENGLFPEVAREHGGRVNTQPPCVFSCQ